MQKLKILLSILGLLTFSWISFFIYKNVQEFEHEKLENHLPQDTHFAIKINNKRFIGNILSDALFKSNLKRKDLILLDKPDNKELTKKIYALTPKNECVLFEEEWNNEPLMGILFYPLNRTAFQEALNTEALMGVYQNGIACILLNEPELDSALLMSHLNNLLAQQKIKSPARNKFALSRNENDQIQLYLSGNNESNINEIISSFNIKNNSLKFKGVAEPNPLKHNQDEAFHYIKYDSTSLNAITGKLPDTVNYYFKGCLDLLGLPTKNIVSTQLQYKGMSLKTIHTQLTLLPKFNGIFRFKDSLKISDFDAETHPYLSKDAFEFQPIKLVDEIYYIIQVGPKELYIGLNENPSFEVQKTPKEFELKGDLSKLLFIEADPFMLGILGSFPLYVNTSAFLKKIKKFSITTKPNENNMLELDGDISFDDNEEASMELIKYLLSFTSQK